MHDDAPQPEPRRPAEPTDAVPGLRPAVPTRARVAARPGGVPPMFAAGAHALARDAQGPVVPR